MQAVEQTIPYSKCPILFAYEIATSVVTCLWGHTQVAQRQHFDMTDNFGTIFKC